MPSACHFDEGQSPKVVRLHHVREEVIASMRLPRDLSGNDLAQALHKLRLFQHPSNRQSSWPDHAGAWGEHHLTIPQHTPAPVFEPFRLSSPADVATHFEISRDALLERLFS